MELPLLDTDLKFFQVQGREYVLDIPSSTLFEIHPNMKRVLELSVGNQSMVFLDEIKREFHFMDWMELIGELRHMIDHRYLTIFASKVAPYELKEQKINSIMLNICHDCNMRCTYCYQGGGTYGKEAEYMSKDTANRAMEFLFKESPDSKVYLYISGGEPLLNPDLVRYIVRVARENEEKYEKAAQIILTTNGTLLDKSLLEYLVAEDVELVISLDGGTAEQNQMRQMANRRPSLDCVKDKLEWVKESGIRYRVKGILHHLNAPEFSNILQCFREADYQSMNFEPVIATSESEYRLSANDILTLKEVITKTFDAYQEKDSFVQRIANFDAAVQCVACQQNLGYSCGAGKNYLSITPSGDIYPCHLLAGNKDFLLGNILKDTLDQEMRKDFYQPLHVLNRKSCQTCWARYFCGGGCVGENYLVNKDLTIPYSVRCELARFGMEKAIEVYCSMLQDEDKLNFSSERRKSGREIYKIG